MRQRQVSNLPKITENNGVGMYAKKRFLEREKDVLGSTKIVVAWKKNTWIDAMSCKVFVILLPIPDSGNMFLPCTESGL